MIRSPPHGSLTLRATLRVVCLGSSGRLGCPARSAHDAIKAVQQKSKEKGRKWVVDFDLKAFFDTVNHDVLMNRLERRIKDRRILSLIGKYLRAGVVLPSGKLDPTCSGVPQGGPLSPLLANILLDDLDQELGKRGHSFARYADDFVILCRSPRAAQRVMESVARFIEQRLKLIVNQTKSKVCEIKDAAFLGFTIVKNRIKWSEKSKAKFKARMKEITKRTRGASPWKVMEELQLYVRGAVNYYSLGMTYAEARELDGWLRRRVRLYYWTATVRSTCRIAKRKPQSRVADKQWGHCDAGGHARDGGISSNSESTVRPFTWQAEVGRGLGG